ncbi:MAG TPA: UvrD-helicase domain-containing protein [Ilumatobacteraceae bacterium]|nr:UvrD-helicase domain-containing protein [Ilumatobacteraceae bacterium]
MATFQPSFEHLDELVDPLSDDALDVARSLAALDDEWTVYIRPQFGQDISDFVLVHDFHGVIVVDVWTGSDLVVGIARRHRNTIVDQFFSLPGDGRDPGPAVRSAVVVPHRSTAEALRLLEIALPSPGPIMAIWGVDALTTHLAAVTTAPPGVTLSSESIRRLHHQLVVDGVSHEQVTPMQLSADARMVAANPRGSKIRGVTGPPGSGKSFALTARAARLAAEGKSVLVLCFNLTLAHRLRGLVVERCAEYGANPARVTCTSFHTFCARVVDDAAAAGVDAEEPARGTWPEKIVVKTQDVLERGFDCHFDAVLIDEGQDFRLQWWNLLRDEVVRPGGEMLLVTDPTVDLYGKSSWATPGTLEAAGFTEPWIDMTGSYRMAPALIESTNLFARQYVSETATVPVVPADQAAVVGHVSSCSLSWRNLDRVADLGPAIGHEVVRLLGENPTLTPRDVVYLCEYHHDGLAAAQVIEAAGYPVHHVYSRDPDERQRRKSRFWPDADAVKGCTVHAFKGWESPAVVLGIGMEERSRRLAYAAMTRVTAARGLESSYLAVLNTDPRMVEFRETFEHGLHVDADS